MLRTWILMLVTAAGVPGRAAATEPTGEAAATRSAWTGTWVLDRSSSDSLDAVLTAQGLPKAKRLVADKVDLTQKLVDHGDSIELEMLGPRAKTGTLTFDGKERTETTDNGVVHYRAKRDPSGAVVVISRSAQSAGLITIVTRTLDADGKTLRQQVKVTGGEGDTISATLVFRRASD